MAAPVESIRPNLTIDDVRRDLSTICTRLINSNKSSAEECALALYEKVLEAISEDNSNYKTLAREAKKASQIIANWPGR